MQSNRRINLGISILRMWMAFEVILVHRMSWSGYDGPVFSFLKSCELFSVPVFLIISFYLSASVIENGSDEKVKQRFIRLIIPQVGWAIVCWLVYVITDIVFMHVLDHGIMDLLIAIVSGCRQNTNPSTWFQAVLIILTVFYCLVFRLFNKSTAWIIVHLSVVFAMMIQADGRYYHFFEYQSYEVMNTIGRIFEVMPYAGLGLILKRIDIFERLKDRRYIAIVVSAFLFIGGFYFTFPQYEGFFAGFYPIYMGLFLFLIFLLLPLENVSSEMRKVIYHVTRFTLGVYCAHRLVYGIMDIVYELLHLEPKAFTRCIMTYLACYIMSVIMSKIPIRVFRRMVE